MAEWALGLLREKEITVLYGVSEEISRIVSTKHLWAKAIGFAADMTNMSTTTSIAGGGTPYSLWYGTEPKMDYLQPFGTTGYMRIRVVINAL